MKHDRASERHARDCSARPRQRRAARTCPRVPRVRSVRRPHARPRLRHCTCGPFHPACALGRMPRCPQCAQPAVRFTGAVTPQRRQGRGRTWVLRGRAVTLRVALERGRGGKCRECREKQADGNAAGQQADDAMMMPLFVLAETTNSLPLYTHWVAPVEQGDSSVWSERGRQRQRVSAPQSVRR